MDFSFILNRSKSLFFNDIKKFDTDLIELIKSSRVLIIGGAGSIGKSVTQEIFNRNPSALHIVDINENNMVELVRMIRSSTLELKSKINSLPEFKTFSIDSGSKEFETFIESEKPYDYVFNLSALKHVRSEKDPFTLMRLINVNILNTVNNLNLLSQTKSLKNYFCISSDKATNPVSLMGASKKIMESFLLRESLTKKITMSRFANVAFSDGSLLHGFTQRIIKNQPIAAPNDVERYFISSQESGQICLLSGLLGKNRDIFFPIMNKEKDMLKFSDIAKNYVESLGYECFECETEEEARRNAISLISEKKWPCFFSKSDTTGEKSFEEFFGSDEDVDFSSFSNLGVIKNEASFDGSLLDSFNNQIKALIENKSWNKEDLVSVFEKTIPGFEHVELGRNLDQKM
jgi:FlaA1/EpsC-like NDP-sugar epimerase